MNQSISTPDFYTLFDQLKGGIEYPPAGDQQRQQLYDMLDILKNELLRVNARLEDSDKFTDQYRRQSAQWENMAIKFGLEGDLRMKELLQERQDRKQAADSFVKCYLMLQRINKSQAKIPEGIAEDMEALLSSFVAMKAPEGGTTYAVRDYEAEFNEAVDVLRAVVQQQYSATVEDEIRQYLERKGGAV